MARSVHSFTARVLAALLLVYTFGAVREVRAEPLAWTHASSLSAQPSLRTSESTPRVELREHKRAPHVVAPLSAGPAFVYVANVVAQKRSLGAVSAFCETRLVECGYDATAPPTL